MTIVFQLHTCLQSNFPVEWRYRKTSLPLPRHYRMIFTVPRYYREIFPSLRLLPWLPRYYRFPHYRVILYYLRIHRVSKLGSAASDLYRDLKNLRDREASAWSLKS